MSYLSWISDEDLIASVWPIVAKLYKTMLKERPYPYDNELKNIFEASFKDMAVINGWGKYYDLYNVIQHETQIQHERILSRIPDWTYADPNVKVRYMNDDIFNAKYRKYAFLAYTSSYTKEELSTLLTEKEAKYKNYEFLLVVMHEYESIAVKKINALELNNKKWRIVSLQEFFDIASGVKGALKQLYDILPKVISDIKQKLSNGMLLPPQIFVSYPRKNDGDLQRLKAEIKSSQAIISVWTDEHLVAGTEDWQIEIERQIEFADCVVLLLTPDCKNSEWVRRELNYAQDLKVPIIPFWVDGTPSQVAMLNIITAQRIDARNDDQYLAKIQQLIRTVEQFSRERQK
jgi:hypothetical protein